MPPARWLLVRTALLGVVASQDSQAQDARRLQAYGGCPTWENTPYAVEPSPFGWPLTPNDWSFADLAYWPKKYLACAGQRQSPIDLPLNSASCGIDRVGEEDGALNGAARYTASVGAPEVHVSHYMRSVHADGYFGDLRLRDESGEAKDYEAISVHITAPSLHKVDGKHMAAELMVMHKPKGDPNMLKEGVIVSLMFDDTNGTESQIFSHFGFPADGMANPAKTWMAPHYIDLAQATSSALNGPSYQYDGSVPVPPCTENIKYFILGQAQPILTAQARSLQEVLGCWAGGMNKRGPISSPYLGQCRAVRKNTATVTPPHWQPTCEEALANGTEYRSGRCWDIGLNQQRVSSCVKSPVDISASKASTAAEEQPHWNFKSIKHVRVMPSNYTVDAVPLEAGVPGPLPNFGTILVLGKKYMVRKIRIKPISSHTYNGVHHVGELIIETLVFGDEMAEQVRQTADYIGEQGGSAGRRLQSSDDELHRLYLSVPMKLGVESSLLRELGLPFQAYKDSIKDMHFYHIESTVNLQAGIKDALAGNYLFYSGGQVEPGCPKWGVRWIMFESPISVSMAQLNYLALQVPGLDSVRMDGPSFSPQDYSKNVFLNALPDWALSWHVACDGSEHWTYDDVHCWPVSYPTCRTGKKQSPINIMPEDVQEVGNAHFLSRVDWKPVSQLHVLNNGHSLQVTNDMLGYIKLIGGDGFPEFYDIAQFHLHMPSEHMINGRQFAAELHVVHTRQRAIGQEKNTYDSFPLVVLGFMFDISDTESHFLKQFFLGEEPIKNQTYKVAKQPIDLMRSLGPALDGDFYRYDGSFTTPDCHEQIKWFVFDHIFSMSLPQWETFKQEFPFAHFNRPVNKLQDHRLVKNHFEEGTPVQYDFFLGRHEGRNRFYPGEFWILVPIIGIAVLMCMIMFSVFVREGRSRLESAGGLTETIGKITYNRM